MGSQYSSQKSDRSEVPSVQSQSASASTPAQGDDDEPDEWDKRIFSTGCADENMKMTDCYYEKKDWRACASEMEQFKQCWKRHGNDQRTLTKNAS